ncbi:Mitotic spindle checkpoint protein MAD1 [Linum perenne]
MMLRTPPPKRSRSIDAAPIIETPPTAGSDRRQLVVYEDPPSDNPDLPHQHSEHMLCTYQCRQMVKSDFLDALSNAEKQVQDYQSQLATLNENFLKADDERKNFREKLSYAEQELAAAKGREKSLHDQLMKEVNDSHERLKKQLELSIKLEAKLENEHNLRKKAESAAAAAEDKASGLEAKLGHISESIERGKGRLNNELVQLKRDTKFSTSKIAGDLEKMEFRARSAEEEVELLRKQLEELQSKFSECLHQKSELEVQISSFSFEDGSPKESNILVKHLQEELRNYESEVREARKLKSSYENIELMKEKLLEEKSRRERAESQLPKLQEYEVNMTKLEDELSAWKLMIQNIPDVSCCDDVPLKISALQKEVIDSMKKLGEVNAQLKQVQVILDTTQLDKQKTETEAALAKEEAGRLEAEVKRISLMLSMVSEERNRLKTVIEDFSSKNEKGGENRTSGVIQELELSLSKKQSYIEDLERDLDAQKGINYRQRDEIKSLHDRLNNEARRIKSLERESDRLHSEISLLESKLGHGDFSAANTKVLRMVNTLAVDNDAKQTIEALQSELQKTKEKLQALEELKSQPGDAGKLVDSYISGKVTQLKEQIATLEKREERYKTVFADRISVFRRACCELFGYKIVMDERQRPNGIPVTRFTLQSIYAQSEDEKLEFEYESGNTNIVANEYTSASEISRQVEIFIRKMNSIPAFTANLTVESFNRRTLS